MCGYKKENCQAVQQLDQMFCRRCGYLWDINDDDPPECKPKVITVQLPGVVREVEITGTFSVDPDEERQKIQEILNKEPAP